jgi:hypothetical protein
MANCPVKIKNLTLDGSWQELRINPEFVALALQARNVANTLLVCRPNETANYWTIQAGSILDMSSGNFVTDDYVWVKGTAADVAELIGFVRE